MSSITQHTLLNGVSATTDGTEYSFPAFAKYRMYQVEITGTATVAIQGRLDDSMSWQDLSGLGSITASGAYSATHAVPLIRARVTAYTSGTITVKGIAVP